MDPVTFAELAPGGRPGKPWKCISWIFGRFQLDFEAVWRAGLAFGRTYPTAKDRKPVLPDFLIRAQAVVLDCKHLTSDRHRWRLSRGWNLSSRFNPSDELCRGFADSPAHFARTRDVDAILPLSWLEAEDQNLDFWERNKNKRGVGKRRTLPICSGNSKSS